MDKLSRHQLFCSSEAPDCTFTLFCPRVVILSVYFFSLCFTITDSSFSIWISQFKHRIASWAPFKLLQTSGNWKCMVYVQCIESYQSSPAVGHNGWTLPRPPPYSLWYRCSQCEKLRDSSWCRYESFHHHSIVLDMNIL